MERRDEIDSKLFYILFVKRIFDKKKESQVLRVDLIGFNIVVYLLILECLHD